MFCKNCGKELQENSKFCPGCGEKVGDGDSACQQPVGTPGKKKKNRMFINILAIIGGIIALIAIISGIGDLKKAQVVDKKESKEESVSPWTLQDLSLYDHGGKEALYFTENVWHIELKKGDGLKTFRDVQIGDNAKKALKKYKVEDMEFGFSSRHYINADEKNEASYEKAQNLTDRYSEVTPVEMLENIEKVQNLDINFCYFIKLYELDDKIYSEKEYTKNEEPDLEYTVFFYIKNDKILNIEISRWGI